MTTYQQEATRQVWGFPKTVCKRAPKTRLSAVEGTGAWEFPMRRMARARAGQGREKAGPSLKGHVAWGRPRWWQGFRIRSVGITQEQMSCGHFVFHGCKRESAQGQGQLQKASCGAGTPWGIPAGREGERVRCFLVEGPGSCRSVLGCPKDSLCPPLPLPLVKSLCHKTVNTTSAVTLWTLSLEVH